MSPEELTRLLGEPVAWMEREGPSGDLAMSTRLRLARNLAGHPFPSAAGAVERDAVRAAVVAAAVRAVPSARAIDLSGVSERARGILVEKFLISPQMAAAGTGSLLLLGDDASAMVNEEDHLRLQCILPGLDLQGAYGRVDAVDDALEEQLDFAFSRRWGYLTACPSNIGSAMRASVMLHLPALAVTGSLAPVFEGLKDLGVTARGIYGEGTGGAGAVFQISNQVTLGMGERELLAKVEGVVRMLADRERAARDRLLSTSYDAVVDRIWRAMGTLKTARSIGFLEAADLLSLVRWGTRERILPPVALPVLNGLLYRIGPAGLGEARPRKKPASSSPAARGRGPDEACANRLRATLLRETFANCPLA